MFDEEADAAVDRADGDCAAAVADPAVEGARAGQRRSRRHGNLGGKIAVHVGAGVSEETQLDRAVDGSQIHRRTVVQVAQLEPLLREVGDTPSLSMTPRRICSRPMATVPSAAPCAILSRRQRITC